MNEWGERKKVPCLFPHVVLMGNERRMRRYRRKVSKRERKGNREEDTVSRVGGERISPC
jgi:hypothetical protein